MKNWLISAGYALLLAAVALLLPKLMQLPFLSVFTAEQRIGNGFELNDAFYQFQNNPSPARPFDVVVLNTESFGSGVTPAFRFQLGELLSLLKQMGASAVGVDFLFAEQPSPSESMQLATALLQKNLMQDDQVVVAHSMSRQMGLCSDTSKWGVVDFYETGRTTIRTHQRFVVDGEQTLPSFAAKLIENHQPGWLDRQGVPEMFPLHYLPPTKSYEHIVARDSTRLVFRQTEGIPVLDALQVVQSPEVFAEWIRRKIVIVGHVSGNPFDIEDKHRVPNDPIFFNRLPTYSGPLIHAVAVDNMLNFEERGWRFVPMWLRNLAAFVLLVVLIHLVLYSHLGKTLNFAFLVILTIPVLYLGFLLMGYGWYWPMSSTLIVFVFIEEIMEVIHPIATRGISWVQGLLSRGSGRAAILLVALAHLLGFASAQTAELMILEGHATSAGVEHSADEFSLFNIYPDQEVEFLEDSKVLITIDGVTAIWRGTGLQSHQQLVEFVAGDGPSLTSEFFRVLFSEGLQLDDNQSNVGAAYRGGGSLKLKDLDNLVVWEDSVWLGLKVPSPSAPPLAWVLLDSAWEERSGESSVGGAWVPVAAGETYNYQLSSYGAELGSGSFRTASMAEQKWLESTLDRLIKQCSDCGGDTQDAMRLYLQAKVPFSSE